MIVIFETVHSWRFQTLLLIGQSLDKFIILLTPRLDLVTEREFPKAYTKNTKTAIQIQSFYQ